MDLNTKITKAIDIQIERDRFIRYSLPSPDLNKCEKLLRQGRVKYSKDNLAYVEKARSFIQHKTGNEGDTDLDEIFVALCQEYEATSQTCMTYVPNSTINLLVEAMQGIDDEALTHEDVYENPMGFMYFERPICTLEAQSEDSTSGFTPGDYVRAIAWHTHYNQSEKENQTRLFFYSDWGIRRHILLPALQNSAQQWDTPEQWQQVMNWAKGDDHIPEHILVFDDLLDWVHETSSHLTLVDHGTGEIDGDPKRTAGARCLFLSAMRLWEQRVFDRYEADHDNDGLDRTTRKRSLRSLPSADAPCVLDYRAPGKSGKRLTGTGAQLEHRHLVRGHWKNAWFPSQQKHKRIWIRPYSRGKDDAPFIDRKKASII